MCFVVNVVSASMLARFVDHCLACRCRCFSASSGALKQLDFLFRERPDATKG
jgi:hypothetical protein